MCRGSAPDAEVERARPEVDLRSGRVRAELPRAAAERPIDAVGRCVAAVLGRALVQELREVLPDRVVADPELCLLRVRDAAREDLAGDGVDRPALVSVAAVD